MSYVVWYGLHGAAAEEYATAAEALEGIRALEQRGAKYIQPTGPNGCEISVEWLEQLLRAQGAQP